MKITIENHIEHIPSKDLLLFVSLLKDLEELNEMVDDNQKMFIDYNLEHTEWSAERTDPCPDYYGMYSLRFENNPIEMIGDFMTIDELDNALFILNDFVQGAVMVNEKLSGKTISLKK